MNGWMQDHRQPATQSFSFAVNCSKRTNSGDDSGGDDDDFSAPLKK